MNVLKTVTGRVRLKDGSEVRVREQTYRLLLEVCEEVAKEPYPDSDPASLLETLRTRARAALDKVGMDNE